MLEVGALDVDPEVHRVGRDERGRADLAEHVELERRIDVAEEDELGVAVRVGELGLEGREHAEPGVEGLAGREVGRVAADPVERLARRALDARDVDAERGELVEVLLREVVADHGDDRDVRVKYDAARAMNEAEPPSRSLWRPNGPSMSSSATEPTTRRER